MESTVTATPGAQMPKVSLVPGLLWICAYLTDQVLDVEGDEPE